MYISRKGPQSQIEKAFILDITLFKKAADLNIQLYTFVPSFLVCVSYFYNLTGIYSLFLLSYF